MPHLFTHRERKHAILADKDNLRAHFTWEGVNVISYELGGAIFIAGSVLFLPKYEDYIADGSWLFVAGSVLYLIVTLHDLTEVLFDHPNSNSHTFWLDAFAAFCYIAGSIVFIAGSVLFLPKVDKFTPGAWCFITGSIAFIMGAVANAMQIFEATSALQARYLNLIACCYIIGSTLFLTGSVPYLWTFQNADDEEHVYRYLAAQFILGSIFFFIGGLINGKQAHLVMKDSAKKHSDDGQGTVMDVLEGKLRRKQSPLQEDLM